MYSRGMVMCFLQRLLWISLFILVLFRPLLACRACDTSFPYILFRNKPYIVPCQNSSYTALLMLGWSRVGNGLQSHRRWVKFPASSSINSNYGFCQLTIDCFCQGAFSHLDKDRILRIILFF